MLKFSANLTWLYREWPLLERPLKAAEDGFGGLELLFPYQFDLSDLVTAIEKSGLPMVLINAPAGDWDAGERGLASLPNREDAFLESLDQAWQAAEELDCTRVHIMAGCRQKDIPYEHQFETLVGRLRHACQQAKSLGRIVTLEPLNIYDVPNYFVPDVATALNVHKAVGHPNLKIQLDLYHQQRTGGNLVQTLARLGDRLGHVQCANVPGRHEPDHGEIDFGFVFKQLERLGYKEWIGAEYGPMRDTRQGLGWLRQAQ